MFEVGDKDDARPLVRREPLEASLGLVTDRHHVHVIVSDLLSGERKVREYQRFERLPAAVQDPTHG